MFQVMQGAVFSNKYPIVNPVVGIKRRIKHCNMGNGW